jgi:hypothetical protein
MQPTTTPTTHSQQQRSYEMGLLLLREQGVSGPRTPKRGVQTAAVTYTLYYKPLGEAPCRARLDLQATQFGEPARRRTTETHAVDFLKGVREGDRCLVKISGPGHALSASFRVEDSWFADLAVSSGVRIECARATRAFYAVYRQSESLDRPLINVYVTARRIELHTTGDETPPFGAVLTPRERRLILFTSGSLAEREHLVTCTHYLPEACYLWWDGSQVQVVQGRILDLRLAEIAAGDGTNSSVVTP